MFSDLLLHDMGDDSGSVIREGEVLPAEWRTAPLRDLASRKVEHGAICMMAGRRASRRPSRGMAGRPPKRRVAFDGLDGRDRQLLLDFVSKL